MENIISWFGIICGCSIIITLCVAITGAFIAWAAGEIRRTYANRKFSAERERIFNELYNMDRWLAYDLPAIEKIRERIKNAASGEGNDPIEWFREEIRKGNYDRPKQ